MRNYRIADESEDYDNSGRYFDKAVNDAVARISATLMISTSIYKIAQTVLDCAIDITESEYGIISFYDGNEYCVSRSNFKIGQIDESILAEDKAFFDNFLEFKRNNEEPEMRMKNILSMPAEMGGEKVGQIVLFNSSRGYSKCDLIAIKQLSELLALAINRKTTEEIVKRRGNYKSELLITFFEFSQN
ncbi:MAG TPA: GAF domain-containing protein [Archaeoglobaceae archaeon]|nr:GAF domain-containing protein [Archaeoglobaceae archaeon]